MLSTGSVVDVFRWFLTCVLLSPRRSPGTSVRYIGARLAQDQAEHRLQVSDCVSSQDTWTAVDSESIPQQDRLNVHPCRSTSARRQRRWYQLYAGDFQLCVTDKWGVFYRLLGYETFMIGLGKSLGFKEVFRCLAFQCPKAGHKITIQKYMKNILYSIHPLPVTSFYSRV